MTELDAMRRAIQLAWQGWGRVAPNPMVGAVLLRDGEIVGEGWHAEFGGLHAESVALAAAGERARGGTMVQTLEPCAHQGKQPPCTRALLDAGISRMVIAVEDPNPIAQGGAERLRGRGIPVEAGVLREEAEYQNAAFLHRYRAAGRPFVALKLATSFDGRIADRAGSSRWISGAEAREYVHWLRAGFDAIGVGGRTARVDDASLTVRGAITPRIEPRRVVFTRTGELAETSRLLTTAKDSPVILAQSGPGSLGARDRAAEGVTIINRPDLAALLEQLWKEGVTSLLVEGGGELAGAMVGSGLVDRFYWIQSPLWLGDRGIPAFQGLPANLLAAAERWRTVERRALGQDTLLVVDRT